MPGSRRRIGPDRRLAVGQDGRAIDAVGVRQEQLGVEPRRLGAGRAQALDPVVEQLARRRHRGDAITAGR